MNPDDKVQRTAETIWAAARSFSEERQTGLALNPQKRVAQIARLIESAAAERAIEIVNESQAVELAQLKDALAKAKKRVKECEAEAKDAKKSTVSK